MVKNIDPVLLLFLIFVLNFRLSFKLIALVGMYAYRPDFKFKRDGIFYFYALMILLSWVNFAFVGGDYSYPHLMVVVSGSLIWLACLLCFHQLRISVEGLQKEKLVKTLEWLTVINFVVSMYDVVKVMLITKTNNPYTQVSPPPYGISSGDLIGGVFGGMHLVNTIICSLLLVFFVYRGSLLFIVLSLIPFLLTGSNLGTFILGGSLLMIAFLNKGIAYKNYAFFCIAFIVLFYIKITPDNQRYMSSVLTKATKQLFGKVEQKKTSHTLIANPDRMILKPDTVPSGISSLNPVKKVLSKEELIIQYIEYRKKVLHLKVDEKQVIVDSSVISRMSALRKRKEKMAIKLNDYVFFRKDSVARSKSSLALFEYGQLKKFDLELESGKITSFKQTGAYLSGGIWHALFGAGIGSFSSRLAFITSGIVEDSRLLMALPHYETEAFKNNHKAIFKYLMYRDDETHSITNLPFCWYNQLLGEYGILGFLAFIGCYCFYWLKRFKQLRYGRYLLIAMLGFFFFDYWYERLSVMVIFEMLMLLDLKLNKTVES
ncbi:MAG: hypothetical protein WCR21_05735 [Bacteroidota bacterium]